MADEQSIRKAQENIKELLELGKTIMSAAPYLNYMNNQLDSYSKACVEYPHLSTSIYNAVDGPVGYVGSFTPTSFNLAIATGSTAMFLSASVETVRIIEDSIGSACDYRTLLFESPLEQMLSDIKQKLPTLRHGVTGVDLPRELDLATDSFAQWQGGLKSDSDLSKDMRNFLERFKGVLHWYRIQLGDEPEKKHPDFSWNKMTAAVAKKGSANEKAMLQQKTIYESLHQWLSPKLKDANEGDMGAMTQKYQEFVKHVFSMLNLLDMPRLQSLS